MLKSWLHGAAPCVMGIINVTPDSFSGDGLGGRANLVDAALDQAARMIDAGASWLDVGGESSRPGARPVSLEQEIQRTIPVVEALLERWPDMPISLDTTKPQVAALGIEVGIHMINDISGAAADAAMFALAKERDVALVLMHNQARMDAVIESGSLGSSFVPADPHVDIVEQVIDDFQLLIAHALAAGVAPHNLVLDPGLGFGKTVAQNLHLVRDLDRIVALGYPVLLAPSRKNFIGQVLDLPPEERVEGTASVVALGAFLGAKILRVHDVKEMSRVVKMVNAIRESAPV